MTALVTSFEKSLVKKDEVFTAGVVGAARSTQVTKPAKVLSWLHNMTLKTFIKQLKTWTEINKDDPEFFKF